MPIVNSNLSSIFLYKLCYSGYVVNKKTSKRPSSARKWHRPKVRTIVLVFIGCLLAYMIIEPVIKRLTLQAQLNSESSEARITALSENKHGSQLAELEQLLQLQSSPTYSAAYNMCYSWHRDGGWVAYTYIYSCEISYVDFFEVPKERSSLLHTLPGSSGNSYVFVDDYLKSIGVEDSKKFIDYFYVVSTNTAQDARTLMSASLLMKNVVGYATTSAYENRELITESGQRELKDQTIYIVLTDEDTYYTKDIGCSRNMILCSSPLGDE